MTGSDGADAPDSSMDSFPSMGNGGKSEIDLPKWDGYDSCIVGMVHPAGPLIYDLDEMVRINARDGMSRPDAEEYVDFNIVSAYIGSNTPIYMTDVHGGVCCRGVNVESDDGDE